MLPIDDLRVTLVRIIRCILVDKELLDLLLASRILRVHVDRAERVGLGRTSLVRATSTLVPFIHRIFRLTFLMFMLLLDSIQTRLEASKALCGRCLATLRGLRIRRVVKEGFLWTIRRAGASLAPQR